MTAMNIVHCRVKADREQEFLDWHRNRGESEMAGFQSFSLVKTGEREYTFVARWDSMQAIVAATKTSAETCRVDHITGSLEKGKFADLLAEYTYTVQNRTDVNDCIVQKGHVMHHSTVGRRGQLVAQMNKKGAIVRDAAVQFCSAFRSNFDA